MKKKRLKLKKWVWYALVCMIFLVIAIVAYTKIKDKYEYEATSEYKLQTIGYSKNEIKKIEEIFGENKLEELAKEEKKDTTLLEYIESSHFIKENYARYLAYQDKNQRYSIDTIIENVNLNLDYKPYETGFKADTTLGNEILVNKYYLLDSTFVPDNLTTVSIRYCWGENHKIKQEVYDNFLNMWNDANKEDIYLMINFAYYPYEEMEAAYNKAKDFKGEKYADETVARAGSNEHQTGLALDIFAKNASSKATFKESSAYSWLSANAYKYGFIERYQEGKEHITGHDAEYWHYRFVGPKAASIIHDNNLTLEEYITYYK